MAGRPDKNKVYPKGRLNQMLSSYLGAGMQSAAATMDPNLPTPEEPIDTPDADYLNNLGQDENMMPPAIDASRVGSGTDIQAAYGVQRPGFFKNLLSGGSAGQGYNSLLKQSAEDLARQRIAQMTTQRAMDEIAARGNQDRLTQEANKNLGALTFSGPAIDKAKADEAFKRGTTPELWDSTVVPVTTAEQQGKLLDVNARNQAMQNPAYAPAVNSSMLDALASQGFKNKTEASTATKNEAEAAKAMFTDLAPGHIGTQIPEFGAMVNNNPVDSLSGDPNLTVQRLTMINPLTGGKLTVVPKVAQAQTLTPPAVDPEQIFNAENPGLGTAQNPLGPPYPAQTNGLKSDVLNGILRLRKILGR